LFDMMILLSLYLIVIKPISISSHNAKMDIKCDTSELGNRAFHQLPIGSSQSVQMPMNKKLTEEISFGEWLHQRRRMLDLTQQDLANQVGCARITLRRIESGTLKPSKELALILLEKLGIPQAEQEAWLRFARGLSGFPGKSTDSFAGKPTTNLPTSLTTFIGREKEQGEIVSLLAKNRLVTLTGAGGIGKTRLSIQTAFAMLKDFPDGIWLVDLAPLSDPELVLTTVLTKLALTEQAGRSPLDILTDFLQNKRVLLILDNCEHLVQACAQLVETLLLASPNLHILATSREALGIDGEMLYLLPPLTTPDRVHATLESLLYYEAVQLIVERAQTALPGFSLTYHNAAAIVQVCQQLDGIPLALELAAARVKVLRMEEIAARLNDRFRLLSGGARTALARHQTLQAMIDWSHSLLSEPECMLLRRLSIFAGGWSLDAAEAVCGDEGIDTDAVLDLLTKLLNKSLVIAERKQGKEARYWMLDTIREYAREKLWATGEGDLLLQRHLAYFVDLAEQAEPELRGPNAETWLDRLEMEHSNIHAALECAQTLGYSDTGMRLVGALWRFWFQRGYFGEGQQWLERSWEHIDTTPAIRARALAGAGFLANFRGDTAQALILCTESLRLAREIDDKWLIAFSLCLLGESYCQNNDYDRANTCLEESLTLARHNGDHWLIAFSLVESAELSQQQHNIVQAAALAEESLGLARKVGDQWLIAFSLFRLGNVAIDRRDYERAEALHEEGLTIRRELGDQLGMAYALLGLANTAVAKGDGNAAWARTEERLALEHELNNKLGVAHVLADLGWMAFEQDDYEQATVYFEKSLALCRELANHWCVAFQLCSIARAALARGHYSQATARLEEGLMLSQAQELKGYIIPLLTRTLGRVAYHRGDYASAWAHSVKSLAGYQEIGDVEGIILSLRMLGCLISMQNQLEKAVRLWGATEVVLNIESVFMDRDERRDYNNAIAAARATLGEEEFAKAWSEGKKMILDEAVAYALQEN
jgi:non-specific serine/threonine protein kinase